MRIDRGSFPDDDASEVDDDDDDDNGDDDDDDVGSKVDEDRQRVLS